MKKKSSLKENRSKIIEEKRAEIDQLLLIAEEIVGTQPDKGLLQAKQALAACQEYPFEQDPYQNGLAQGYHGCASAYLILGDYGKALDLFTNSLAIYQTLQNQVEITSQFNNIGIVYAYCGVYDEALKNMRSALSLVNADTPLDMQAEILNNIGFTFVALGDYSAAVPYLLESLQIAEKYQKKDGVNHPKATANIYDSLCQASVAMGNLENALSYGLKCIELCNQSSDQKKEAEYLLSLGEVYIRLGDLDEAAKCYQRAFGLARGKSFRREEADALRRLGNLYNLQGNPGQAMEVLKEALSIAQELNIRREIFECHLGLVDIYKQTGMFEMALYHFEQFHKIKEEVFNDQSDQRIRNLETIHQVKQARREMELFQQKSIELQKEIEKRTKAQELAETRSRVDSLTNVFNRGYFFSLAQQYLVEAIENKTPLSFIIADIDHFKEVNDHFGHIEGDHALISIANQIKTSIRQGDIVGRYGGEEFVIILPLTNVDMAIKVAERVRESISLSEISSIHKDLRLTASFGVSTLHDYDGETVTILEELLKQADQAMYEAKNLGRNRVIAFTNR